MSNLSFSAKVNPVQGNDSLKGFATLIINDVLEIKNFSIRVSGKGETFVSFPRRPGKDKEGKDTWFPDLRVLEDVQEGQYRGPIAQQIYDTIMNEYMRMTRGGNTRAPQSGGNGGGGGRPQDRASAQGGRPAVPPASNGRPQQGPAARPAGGGANQNRPRRADPSDPAEY